MKIDRDTFVKAITEISERTEELYSDIQRSYDQLLKEVKGKRKKETKMTPNGRCIGGLGMGHANIRDSSSSSPFPAQVGSAFLANVFHQVVIGVRLAMILASLKSRCYLELNLHKSHIIFRSKMTNSIYRACE